MIEIICEHCGAGLDVPEVFQGQVIKCLHCWEEVKVVRHQERAGAMGGMTMSVAWMNRVDGGERPVLLLEGQPDSVHEWVDHECELCDKVDMLKEKREDGSGETGMWDVRELEARRRAQAAARAGRGGQQMQVVGQVSQGEDWVSDVGELSEEDLAAIREHELAVEHEAVVSRMREREVANRREALGLGELVKQNQQSAVVEKKKEEQALATLPVGVGMLIGLVGAVGWAVLTSTTGYEAGYALILIVAVAAWLMKLVAGRSYQSLGIVAVVVMILSLVVGKAGIGLLGVEKIVTRHEAAAEVTDLKAETAVLMQMMDEGMFSAAIVEQLTDIEWGEPLEGAVSDEIYSAIRGRVEAMGEAERSVVVQDFWVQGEAVSSSGLSWMEGTYAAFSVMDIAWVLLAGAIGYFIAGFNSRSRHVSVATS